MSITHFLCAFMQTIHTSFMWLVHIISSRIYVNPYFNLNSHRLAHICVNPSQCMLFIVYGQFTQFSCNSHNSTVMEWHSCRSVRMHITLGSNAHKNLVGWIHIILVAMHTSFQWWNSRRSVRRPGVWVAWWPQSCASLGRHMIHTILFWPLSKLVCITPKK